MKKEDFSKISIKHFARQVNLNVIAETDDFIVSKSPTTLKEHSLDFDYPHIIEGIAFVFCVSGNARIRINLEEHKVHENTVLVVVPNNIIQVLNHSEDLKVEFLFFTFDFISNMRLSNQLGYIVKAVEEQASLNLDTEFFKELLTIHGLIVKQYRKPVAYREDVIKNLLYALVYQILQSYAFHSVDSTDKTINRKQDIHMRFIGLLYEHYKSERSVQFYADKLFLTPKYFSKVIHEISGKSVLAWVDEIVIMAAKAMLKSSELSVAQISQELNFPNSSFFGTYFRKRVNMTPLQYRER
ncbi:helix-turn-helix domain-containing protein [Sphingobacterium multivorum]|uniref:helix-turn-helix domain-containing protein n=1 Tax=Sphingobacterium multivorum TaxID=28454 RepID=UPI00142D6932|nr:helix-turn-helix domain-containing protein [Sphingobacterium multivorum]QQT46636.1 AraC family transcriptional regulator [Sphingobacterium multivorum]